MMMTQSQMRMQELELEQELGRVRDFLHHPDC